MENRTENEHFFHAMSAKQVLKILETDAEMGLDSQEVARRKHIYGRNEFAEKRKTTPLQMFLAQFSNVMIIILIAAAVIAALLGELLDAAAIMAIVILNAILGFVQEYRAEKALESLKKMIVSSARVVRNGKVEKMGIQELVPGDVVLLEEGERVPADIRLVESHSVEAEEASLTGESVPVAKEAEAIVEKEAAVSERESMLFMGTVITKGKGRGIVCFTGGKTQLGNIAQLVQDTKEEKSPLQKNIDTLGKQLGIIVVIISGIVFATGILGGESVFSMFFVSVSLAVAAIPSALPAIVTITLAIGVQKMVKRHSIVRKLPAVEGLGSTTVICTDKTGTLTKNEMTVRKIFTDGKTYSVTGNGYHPKGEFHYGDRTVVAGKEHALNETLLISSLCNNANLVMAANTESAGIIGDPTEASLLVAAKKAGIDYETEKKGRKVAEELVFDSQRKMMTVIFEEKKGMFYAATKGAPESILESCTHILRNGKSEKMNESEKKRILEKNAEFAGEALRVLGIAYRRFENEQARDFRIEDVEKEMVFAGLVAMNDPPREEAKEAIRICKDAGIRVVMITGDSENTARAIGRELGLLEKDGLVMGGRELEKISEEELAGMVGKITIFARVSPEHKLKIVKALQKNGEVVAMTGDGVNDAPAIKKADIGVAMGITGTDVAKESADMVITDDNFASIVAAVEEGRTIFANIFKSIKFLLSCNMGEVFTVFFALIIGLIGKTLGIFESTLIPLIPMQILWMNLVTDSLPALAFGTEPKEPDIMKKKPRSAKENIMNLRNIRFFVITGFIMSMVTLSLFLHEYFTTNNMEKARTLAFSTIIIFQLFMAFSFRSEHRPLSFAGLLKNWYMVLAFIIGVSLQVGIVQFSIASEIFETVPLSIAEWAAVMLAGASVLLSTEALKRMKERKLFRGFINYAE